MKRIINVLIVPIALFLAACGSKVPQKASADSTPKQESTQPAGSFVTLAKAAQKQAGISTIVIESRSMPQVIRATARVVNDENYTWRVGAVTEGRIVSVEANPGDVVRDGQVLARMHSHDIHESRAEYRKALTELARLKVNEGYAERVRDRAKRLYELKAASMQELEHAETELRNAQTAVANAQVDVERTRLHLVEFLGIPTDVTEHKSGVSHDHDPEEFIPVRAPANGTLLTRNITPGTVVTPSMDLFVISNLAHLWAIAEVNEEYLSKLRPGMPARLSVQAYGDRAFPGRIGKIGDSLDPSTHTVRVRIDLSNPGGALKPEMYATAEIETGGSAPAVFIEPEALQEVRGATVVFVQTADNKFEVRPVPVGRTIAGMTEVPSGLNPGERIVNRGAFILKSEFLKSSLAEE